MTEVVLSLGSNLGDRRSHLSAVVEGLGDQVLAVSPLYETPPWGGVDQGPFLNAVVIARDPACGAHDWLRRAHAFEAAADRVRDIRWGPRTLDVDLVACFLDSPGASGSRGGEVIIADDDLTLPHPMAQLRAFVLVPWLAVDPEAELTLAQGRRRVADVLAEIPLADRAAVRPVDRQWTTR